MLLLWVVDQMKGEWIFFCLEAMQNAEKGIKIKRTD
jgi:hypothetical protein